MNNPQKTTTMPKWRVRLAALVLAWAVPAIALAEISILGVTSTQQAGADVVRIELSGPLATVPSGFSVQTPPRVAIDLLGVVNGVGKSLIDINQGNLRSVAIAQAGERTRLVLNLRQPANYRTELQGKALVVVLDNASAPKTRSGQPPAARTARCAPRRRPPAGCW